MLKGIREEQAEGCVKDWADREVLEEEYGIDRYEAWYRDEYFENHFAISLEKLSLMLPPDFMENPKSYNGESGCLLEMCEDNKRDTILHTIENMVDYDTNIEIVTMDMACGYRSYIQECLPRATIVVDKFHVYQDFLTKVGTVKTKITEHIKSRINAMPEGPEKEHLNAIMKMAQANNYLFRFGEEKIAGDPSRLSKMANICEAFPEFNHLRLIRTGFERIYASADRASAEAVCDKWAKLIPPAGHKQITAWEEHFHVDAELFAELRPFRNTITRNWRNEIFNYFNVNCQFTNAVAKD